MLARDELNRKMEEQARLAQLRHSAESQVRHEVEEMRCKLRAEMARARDTDERDRRDPQRRRLIEKSYSLNFAPAQGMKDKELSAKGSVLEARPAPQPLVAPVIAISSPDSSLSHILRRELEKSIRKSSEVVMDQACTSSPSGTADEHMERLRKKYFLH
ncbi:uncharacterized protein LOC134532604 isoform X2 [Bacillus rossius redtenbacheri]|uniref:uncharacterized protein LOC134532604 isoform X2 n=1 Tax=Bacillus rossius redtenbacheri TaxID=93214 RepID=UPI002FDD2453